MYKHKSSNSLLGLKCKELKYKELCLVLLQPSNKVVHPAADRLGTLINESEYISSGSQGDCHIICL
jgi:hypothetical protein